MLIASVGVDSIFVNRPPQAEHATWDGVNLIDLIFPVFVTMTGCGIAFAYARGIDKPMRLVRRVVVLFAIGFLYDAVASGDWDPVTLRWFGVLQLYAVVILVVSLLHLFARSIRSWMIVLAVVVVAVGMFHIWWAIDCGSVTAECNPSRSIDLVAIPSAHLYWQGDLGHDPEGFVAITGAILQACVGAFFGHLVLACRDRSWSIGRALGIGTIASVAVVAVGFAVRYVPTFFEAEPVMIMKRLWTAPFALIVGGIVGFVLIVFYLLIDRGSDSARERKRAVLEPFLALGRNSLLVYFGSHAVNHLLARNESFLAAASIEPWWFPPIVAVLAWMLLAMILNRIGLYIRA